MLAGIVMLCSAANWLTYPFGSTTTSNYIAPNNADTFLYASVGSSTNYQINATNLVNYIKTNVSFGLYYGATNIAPRARVANPLVSGGTFTCPNAQGRLTVNVVCTNGALAWLTNITTTGFQYIGAINNFGTNYDSFYMDTGPNEVIQLTNKNATIGIVSSEWRP